MLVALCNCGDGNVVIGNGNSVAGNGNVIDHSN